VVSTPLYPPTYNSVYFGTAVANIGDFDDDGYEDLVVSAQGSSTVSGSIWIYLMKQSKVSRIIPIPVESLVCVGDQNETFSVGISMFGNAISSNDINNDGVTDLVIGSPFFDTLGSLFILLLNSDGQVTSCIRAGSPDILGIATSGFGRSVETLSVKNENSILVGSGGNLDHPQGKVFFYQFDQNLSYTISYITPPNYFVTESFGATILYKNKMIIIPDSQNGTIYYASYPS